MTRKIGEKPTDLVVVGFPDTLQRLFRLKIKFRNRGVVAVGAEVELLDSKECAPMVGIRVLTGRIKGETGCISANALSSFKP